jgi:catechol 2,3-dioxygenase-like lactoylglutathione lyase family enzyme
VCIFKNIEKERGGFKVFLKIDHVNISVKNIKVSVKWYRDVFGFEKVESGLNSSGSKYVVIENQDTMICMSEHINWKPLYLQANDQQHKIFHFGFRVDNELERKEVIRIHDLTLTYDEVDYPRSKSWYVLDPGIFLDC